MRAHTFGRFGLGLWRPMLVLLALAAVLGVPGLARAAEPDSEQWYIIELMGKPAGRAVERRTEREGTIVQGFEMTLSLARMGSPIELEMKTEFVETADGKPVSMMSHQALGTPPTVDRYTFTEAGIEKVSVSAAGRETRSTLPRIAEPWMTPEQVSRHVRAALEAGQKTVSYTSIDPMSGTKTITSTMQVQGPENVEVFGKVVPALKVIESQSMMPSIKTTSFLNAEGKHLISEIPLGGITMRLLAADKELAAADVEGVEIMASTTVTPEGEIVKPREARRLSFHLSMTEGDMPALLHAGAQRVEVIDAGSARVILDVDNPLPAGDDAGNRAFSDSSSMVDTGDPMIKELAAQAVQGAGDDPTARALSCRAFVARYIDDKNLGVGFATASEVAATKQGDCSEHGVLLCALLRASGIPARVVSGLVYVDQFAGQDNIFGYHMWTQALLPVNGEPCWVDLDATLPDGVAFDAAHIAVAASALEEGDTFNSMIGIAELMGRLKIRVEPAQ